MLSGSDLKIVGLHVEWDGPICRPCAVKRFGEHTVARIYEGLGAGLPEVTRYTMYEAREESTENGYQEAEESDHDELGHEINEHGRCEACSAVYCFDCGERLDEWDDEPVAALTGGSDA